MCFFLLTLHSLSFELAIKPHLAGLDHLYQGGGTATEGPAKQDESHTLAGDLHHGILHGRAAAGGYGVQPAIFGKKKL